MRKNTQFQMIQLKKSFDFHCKKVLRRLANNLYSNHDHRIGLQLKSTLMPLNESLRNQNQSASRTVTSQKKMRLPIQRKRRRGTKINRKRLRQQIRMVLRSSLQSNNFPTVMIIIMIANLFFIERNLLNIFRRCLSDRSDNGPRSRSRY